MLFLFAYLLELLLVQLSRMAGIYIPGLHLSDVKHHVSAQNIREFAREFSIHCANYTPFCGAFWTILGDPGCLKQGIREGARKLENI